MVRWLQQAAPFVMSANATACLARHWKQTRGLITRRSEPQNDGRGGEQQTELRGEGCSRSQSDKQAQRCEQEAGARQRQLVEQIIGQLCDRQGIDEIEAQFDRGDGRHLLAAPMQRPAAIATANGR